MKAKKRKVNVEFRPTGFEASALPFWKLDDGTFEQFCTDWLNHHPTIACQREGKFQERRVVSAARLLGGTNQRGADIRVEMESDEVWLLQCKQVKSFGPAKVTEAINLVEKENPDAHQYVLVTSCGLSDEAQENIHSRERWMWWDSSRLTSEVQKLHPVESGMKLVQSFEAFGIEWVKRLFPWGGNSLLSWDEFFAQDLAEDRRMFHHQIEFIAGETLLTLESFARDGAGKSLVLSGSGGQGKSRLLLELARKLHGVTGMPRMRFLSVGGKHLEAEAIDLLGRERDLLLVIEDAHRLDEVLGQVASATSKSKTIRLLVATRPQAREAVTSQLFQNGYAERMVSPISLPRWKTADMQLLAERVLQGSYRLHAPRLAALADRCPLLVVLGGALINSGSIPEAMTDETSFRERVFKRFQEEFLRFHESDKRERLRRLIRLVAFVSPTQKAEAFYTKAAEILGCSALDVADDLDALAASGLLAENREGIRLYPDLFSDAVAVDACMDGTGRASQFLKTVIAKLPTNDFPALLRNLAQADWESRAKRKAEDSFFDPVWDEFTHRFQAATWWGRRTHLAQWSAFGAYQPERTIELAQLALTSAAPQLAPSEAHRTFMGERDSMLEALPAMLKPIIMWHRGQADKALDILWQLESKQPQANHRSDASPIGVISSVAEFSVENHHGPDSVLTWLEKTLSTERSLDRLRREQWLLPALLKPYFARSTERSWSTGRTVHLQEIPLSAERTKPFRDRALAIAARFSTSRDLHLALPSIETLKEGTKSLFPRFGRELTEKEFAEWRPARLDALAALGSAINANRNATIIQLVIRRHLWQLAKHDRDQPFSKSSAELLSTIPDTFDLRFLRCLSAWPKDEMRIANNIEDYERADRDWDVFCGQVVREAARQLRTITAILEFLNSSIKLVGMSGLQARPEVVMRGLCSMSDQWTQSLLEVLPVSRDSTLDWYFGEVLNAASSNPSELYLNILRSLPLSGRILQVCALIEHLARKGRRDGGLEPHDRASLELCAARKEAGVVKCMASALGLHLVANDWSCELLSRLIPESEHDATEIVTALARLIEKHPAYIQSEWVRSCLSHVGEHCLPENPNEGNTLQTIMKAFPKESYEHLRHLVDSATPDHPSLAFHLANRDIPRLGKLEDDHFVDCEIKGHWGKAGAGEGEKHSRLALIRLLLLSDLGSIEARLANLAESANTPSAILNVAQIVATTGSRFVFQFPNTVRMFLDSASKLDGPKEMFELLVMSACGGGRGYTDNQLDQEYRYIRTEAEKRAAEFGQIPILKHFYEQIVDYEIEHAASNARSFPTTEDFEE